MKTFKNHHRKPWRTLALATLCLSFTALRANDKPVYQAKEASFDVFASYTAAQQGISHLFDTSIRNGSWGGGLGMNYFATQKLGLGTEVNISNNGGAFVDSTSVNLLLRWPLGKSGVAPYLLGGGGRAYDPTSQWIGQAGAGLELRSEHTLGVFAEGRYIWGEKGGTDQLMLRAGLRFMF